MALILSDNPADLIAGAFFDDLDLDASETVEVYRPPFRIVVDTREQAPFRFTGFTSLKSQGGGKRIVVELVTGRGLETGDYSVAGMESRVAIERKSKSDLFGSLGRERQRFEREFQRLNELEFAAVVVECDWHEIFTLPPAKTQMTAESVEGSVESWSVKYPRVGWHFCRDRRHAEWRTFRLLEFCHKELWGKKREQPA